jgi:hypothetical protein
MGDSEPLYFLSKLADRQAASPIHRSVIATKFVESWQNGMFGFHDTENITISLNPPTYDHSILQRSIDYFDRSISLVSAIEHWLQMVGMNVACHGSIEVFLSFADIDGQPFVLREVMPETTRKIAGRLVQIVLPCEEQPFGLVRALDQTRTFRIDAGLPPGRFRTALRRIASLDHAHFIVLKAQQENVSVSFDVQQELVGRAMLMCGRDISFVPPYTLRVKNMSDTYYTLRSLLLARRICQLRTRAISVLNAAWSVAGKRERFTATVAVEGYPDIEEFDAVIGQLLAGEISPANALRLT